MIVFLEEPEAWSLMMLLTAVAVDNAELSDDGREAIRRWRADRRENSAELQELTDALNDALNAHIDSKFMRRIKTRGSRADTVKR
jgi:hypothetical protein